MTLHVTDDEGSDGGAERPLPLPSALLHEFRQALQAIRHGTIELLIHNPGGSSSSSAARGYGSKNGVAATPRGRATRPLRSRTDRTAGRPTLELVETIA